jgi:hypothetical protein
MLMAEATNTEAPVAFFWSAVTELPSDWPKTVRAVVGHADFRVTVETDRVTGVGSINVFDRARFGSERRPSVYFSFSRGRGAGQVLRSSGDLAVLAALKIALALGLDIADAAGTALPSNSPLLWLRSIDFDSTADEVEALAVQVGLINRRFSLTDLARPQTPNETALFF